MAQSNARFVSNPNTEVDVQMLWQAFPDIVGDGREITHEQIEEILLTQRTTSRYRLIVKKWRRRVEDERGVFLDGMVAQGRGFIALAPNDCVRFGNRNIRYSARRIRKAIKVASLPDDRFLSQDMRRYRSLLMTAAEKISKDHRDVLRRINASLAQPQQLPRAQPPK